MASPLIDVAIIGGGFCGLGLAAALKRYGVHEWALFEQGPHEGAFWRGHYDRLRLHSPWHGLPVDGGLAQRLPMYKSRDELVAYFQQYSALHGLGPHLRFGEQVLRIRREDAAQGPRPVWEIETLRGVYRSRYVAVCTGMLRVPDVPRFAGQETFRGELLHSRSFVDGRPFAGKRVVVVGNGNSACELALELSERGAASVAMLVNGPRHFIRLSALSRFMKVMRLLGQQSPGAMARLHRLTPGTRAFDRTLNLFDALLAPLLVDMRPHGISRPEVGFTRDMVVNKRAPVFDTGTIDAIERGAIRVVRGRIARFQPNGLRLEDGREEPCEAVILATGFWHGLEELLADAGRLLGPRPPFSRGVPLTDRRCRSLVWPELFFLGFDMGIAGGLGWGMWGWEVGELIATELGTFRESDRPAEFGGSLRGPSQ